MLLVSEIYRTILGESVHSGRLCSIVRLTGCHRRCGYCDSGFAFQGGRSMAAEEVLVEVETLGAKLVLLSGGEPLLQLESIDLMEKLVDAGYEVVLETSGTKGANPLSSVPGAVCRIVDVKTPGSGIPQEEIVWDELKDLGSGDELKFVCTDRADYEWSRDLILEHGRLPSGPVKTMSPAYDLLPASELAEWIVADGLNVRFQVQLHRYVWPDRERGV